MNSKLNFAELRELAGAAISGPWQFVEINTEFANNYEVMDACRNNVIVSSDSIGEVEARYIAAANPAIVLTLLDRLEERNTIIKMLEKELSQSSSLIDNLTKMLSEQSASQQGSEPVARVTNKYGDPDAFAERDLKLLVDIQTLPLYAKLYTHPIAPADKAVLSRGDAGTTDIATVIRGLGYTSWPQSCEIADAITAAQAQEKDNG